MYTLSEYKIGDICLYILYTNSYISFKYFQNEAKNYEGVKKWNQFYQKCKHKAKEERKVNAKEEQNEIDHNNEVTITSLFSLAVATSVVPGFRGNKH